MRFPARVLRASLFLSVLSGALCVPLRASDAFTAVQAVAAIPDEFAGAQGPGPQVLVGSDVVSPEEGEDIDDGTTQTTSTHSVPGFSIARNIWKSRPIQFLFGDNRRRLGWAALIVFGALCRRFLPQGRATAETQTVDSRVPPLDHWQPELRCMQVCEQHRNASTAETQTVALHVPPLEHGQLEQRCMRACQACRGAPRVSCILRPESSIKLPYHLLKYLAPCKKLLEDFDIDPHDQEAMSGFTVPLLSIDQKTLHDLIPYLADECCFDLGDDKPHLILRIAHHAQRNLTGGELLAVLAAAQTHGCPDDIIYGVAQRIAALIQRNELPIAALEYEPPERNRAIAKCLYLKTGLRDRELPDFTSGERTWELCDDATWRLTPREMLLLDHEQRVITQEGSKLDLCDNQLTSFNYLEAVCYPHPIGVIETIDGRRCNTAGPSNAVVTSFESFSNLKELNLAGNRINDFYAQLPGTLTELCLAGCGLQKLSDNALKGLTRLETLRLNHNRLEKLPARLRKHAKKLPGLRYLDLSYSGLKEDDGEPFKIVCKRTVRIPPPAPGVIAHRVTDCLVSILYDGCWIGSPPNGNASALRESYSYADAGLTQFPSAILPPADFDREYQFRSRPNRINLSRNYISSVPDTIRQFVCLRYLNLSDNAFDHFPGHLCMARNLEELYLAGNRIANFESLQEPLSYLKTLSLADNNLDHFPEQIIECCPNLEVLRLEGNTIKELPESISRLTKLRRIYLDRNIDLKELPTSMGHMSRLKFVGMRGIDLNDDERKRLRRLFRFPTPLFFSDDEARAALNEVFPGYHPEDRNHINDFSEYEQTINDINQWLRQDPITRNCATGCCATFDIHLSDYNVALEIGSYSVERNHVEVGARQTALVEVATTRGEKFVRRISRDKTYNLRLDQLLKEWTDNGGRRPRILWAIIEADLTKDIISFVQSIPYYERGLPMKNP